jgi:O-antigen/teichoic acid export membrane protein
MALLPFLKFGGLEAFSRGLNWLLILALAFILPPQEYGMVSVLIAIEGLLLAFFLLGLDKAVLRFLPESKGAGGSLMASVSGLWFINAAILVVVLGCLFFFSDNAREKVFDNIGFKFIIAFIIFVPLLSFQKIALAFNRSINNVKGFLFDRAVIQLVRFFLVLFLALYFGNFSSYLIGSLLALSLLLVTIRYIKKYCENSEALPAKLSRKNILIFSWPFIPHMLSGACLSYIDRLMLKEFLDLEAVASYSLAYLIGSSLVFIYGVCASYFEPKFYKSDVCEKNQSAFQASYLMLLIFLGATASVLLIGVLAVIEDYFAGIGYVGISNVAFLVLFAHLGHAFYLISNYRLTLLNKTKFIASGTLLASLLNIALNYVLIPVYGEVGAAYSTLASFMALAFYLSVASGLFKGSKNDDHVQVKRLVVFLYFLAVATYLMFGIAFGLVALVATMVAVLAVARSNGMYRYLSI